MKKLRKTSFDSMLEAGAILAGTPDDICQQLSDYIDVAGEFEYLSMQVNFHVVSFDEAAASMRLFSEQVMPEFRKSPAERVSRCLLPSNRFPPCWPFVMGSIRRRGSRAND